MASDKLLQALKAHFERLNEISERNLEEAVQVHTESLQGKSASAEEFHRSRKRARKNEVIIRSKLKFHQVNLEIGKSKFTEIQSETPLTSMISAIKQEHNKFLEIIPDPEKPTPGVYANLLYKQFLLPR